MFGARVPFPENSRDEVIIKKSKMVFRKKNYVPIMLLLTEKLSSKPRMK
jgi:hypothetical protein